MNKQKTLVILSPGFPENEADSVCLPMQQQLILAIKKLYPDVGVVVLSFQYPYHTTDYSWNGIRVISFNGRNKGGLSRLLLRRKIMSVLKQIASDNQLIGVLSFWLGECAWVGNQFSRKMGVPHFCWILGQDAKKENPYVKRVRPKAGELIALSDFLQDEMEKNHGIRPFMVIPPGIEERKSAAVAKDIDLLAVGSLIPLKRYEIFVEAVSEIKKHIPAVKAVLAGDGPEKEKILQLIETLGLGDTIMLTGQIPHHEVMELMNRSKILLHPSAYEGFGIVCLEALQAGGHVISFCHPMKQDIGQWHVVDSVEEMEAKTIELLTDERLVYRAHQPFSIDDTAKKMMGLMNKKAQE